MTSIKTFVPKIDIKSYKINGVNIPIYDIRCPFCKKLVGGLPENILLARFHCRACKKELVASTITKDSHIVFFECVECNF